MTTRRGVSEESAFPSLKRFLVGKPIPSHLAHHERLSRVTGLAVLSFTGYWKWQEWASLTLGMWIVVSSWAMVKSATGPQLAVHIAVGTAIGLRVGTARLHFFDPADGRAIRD